MICRGGMLVCWLAGWLVGWLLGWFSVILPRPIDHSFTRDSLWLSRTSGALCAAVPWRPMGKPPWLGNLVEKMFWDPQEDPSSVVSGSFQWTRCWLGRMCGLYVFAWKKKYNYIYIYVCVCISALLFELLYLVFHRFHRIVSFFIALSIYLSIHPSKSPMYLFLCKSVLFTTPTVPTSSHLILAELPPVSSWNGRCKPPQRPQHVAPHRIWFSTGRRLGHPPLTRRFSPFWLGAIVLWLVAWNIFYLSIRWECHHPNWLSYFSEGLKPPISISISILFHEPPLISILRVNLN